MTEFKQIIGRGTRLRTDVGKTFFTILDFRGVTRLFADPAFDGEPVVIMDIEPGKPMPDPQSDKTTTASKEPNTVEEEEGKYKPIIEVAIGSLKLRILDEKVQYLNEQGELVSEDIELFSQREIQKDFASYEQFQQSWTTSGEIFSKFYTNEKWLNSLRKKNQLGAQFDDYDVIRKVAYGKVLLTKQARIEKAKQSDYLVQYPEENRQVLRLLLDKYAKSGTKDLS